MASSDSSSSPSPASSTALCFKLCYLHQAKLVSIPSSQSLSFSKLLSLAAQAFPDCQRGGSSKPGVEFSFTDEDGDSVVLDGEQAVSLAAPFFLKPRVGVIKLEIHLKNQVRTEKENGHFSSNRSSSSPKAPDHGRPHIPCRHFEAGRCRFGSSCKFLHGAGDGSNLRNPRNLVSDEYEIDRWFAALQKNASEHDIIYSLTSPEGYENFLHVLGHPRLPRANLHQIVIVLTHPKLRHSLLKQATDKIYNAVAGSQFMNAIHSHIRANVKPTVDQIEPYVLLSEEIISRTSDGWKEAPLDELRTLLDDLNDDSVKDLNNILARLFDYRAQKKRLEAVDENLEKLSLVSSNFRDMTIIPPKEQILSQKHSHQLPMNYVGLRYPNVGVYLDTHFRLMQEDCIATLRDGIHELRKNSKADLIIHVYANVCLVDPQCGRDGMVFRISFSANTRRAIDWQSAKRLMFGSLLCMSCDKFQTLVWAVVASRTEEQLNKSMVDIQILESSDQTTLQHGDVYVMAESSAAYFEAYSHVLRNLQRPEMDKLPFQEHLIALEPHVKEPAYLKERNREDIYDFECAFPQMKNDLRTTQFHILQIWPEWVSSLDKSQMAALKHGLTKRLALIQGPPGTGKTFIGLLIVRIMLANLKQVTSTYLPRPLQKETKNNHQEDILGGPILIICYTNHALDQFLEGIYAHEKNIVRIGGRSKSSELEACNFQKLLYRETGKLAPLLKDEQSRIYKQKQDLEEQILHCANLVKVEYVTIDMLDRIATDEQIRSLFYKGCNMQTVVKLWLYEKDKIRRTNQVHLVQPRQSLIQNHFDILETSTVSDYVGEGESSGISKLPGNTNEPIAEGEDPSLWATTSIMSTAEYSQDLESLSGFDIHEEIEDTDIDDIECNKDKQEDVWKPAGNTSIPEPVNTDAAFMDIMRENSHSNIICRNNVAKKWPADGMAMIEACEETDSAWAQVKPRGRKFHLETNSDPSMDEMTSQKEKFPLKENQEENQELLQQFSDVWSLSNKSRRALHTFWVSTIRQKAQEKINDLYMQYTETCQKKQEIDNELQLLLLRKAKVVGMTTTVAARYHSVLESLQAEIVVVEEAAEVLESHIVAGLTTSTKHLILIGDHLQLRPAVAVYKLAVKHKLDVSLFERLVKSGVEYVTLEVQRRMRPSISRLIAGIYPMLKDHESVSTRENIKGMKSNVFFLHHTAPEMHHGDDDSGKVNVVEAQLVAELCCYLLKQQYLCSDITILSMYRGQTQEISKQLAQKLRANPGKDRSNLPRISSVDDFQGEECKIIILSLVRNNILPTAGAPGKIGFLAVSNRMCVALSRARDGLFMFGNGDLLSKKSELWEGVLKKLQQCDSYGDALVLTCQNHPDREIKIQKPSDFQNVPDGGCDKPCEHQLNCGHVCPKRCHPGPHDKIVCPKRCTRKLLLCGHQCQRLCHGFDDCPPCAERIIKILPKCGHSVMVSCSANIESVICQKACPKVLDCSHNCQRKCGEQCTVLCNELVKRALTCNHFAKLPCHKNPATHLCRHPCRQVLPECKHSCQGTCGTCKQGQTHIPCQQKCNRSLVCGHPCAADCHQVCPPCNMPCQKRCPHSRCPKQCGYPCIPCMEPCLWKCRHHACKMLCHEICNRPCCDEPCQKSLPCGHRCLGFCGEPCPTICRLCTPDFQDTISLLTMDEFEESDRFVLLQDCSHVFEVSGLDTWMHSEPGTTGISPKNCPDCRTPITRSFRYGNQVKANLHQIEEVKKRILDIDITNEGIKLLRQKQYDMAVDKFVIAIERNSANFEARLGLGSALCLQKQFKEGIQFFQSVVQNSSLRSEVSTIDPGKIYSANRDSSLFGAIFINQGRFKRTKLLEPPPESQADKKVAIGALVQWATALSNMGNLGNFSGAEKACQIVLREAPDNKEAQEILKSIREGLKIQMEVVGAMAKEVGGRGHWFKCPNGHLYAIGECGGAMQESKCPDCKAPVGGQNHALAAGNTHSSIDGSAHAAWSNGTGLGGFGLF